jgi:hypothetical protein
MKDNKSLDKVGRFALPLKYRWIEGATLRSAPLSTANLAIFFSQNAASRERKKALFAKLAQQ